MLVVTVLDAAKICKVKAEAIHDLYQWRLDDIKRTL